VKTAALLFACVATGCVMANDQSSVALVSGFGLETGKPILLTAEERARAYCIEGEILVCRSAIGRLDRFQCVCSR
jgi:hypothetical protein